MFAISVGYMRMLCGPFGGVAVSWQVWRGLHSYCCGTDLLWPSCLRAWMKRRCQYMIVLALDVLTSATVLHTRWLHCINAEWWL